MGKKVKARKARLYKIEGKSLKRLRQTCSRCGAGVFMAKHKNRLACGKCGYTEYIKK